MNRSPRLRRTQRVAIFLLTLAAASTTSTAARCRSPTHRSAQELGSRPRRWACCSPRFRSPTRSRNCRRRDARPLRRAHDARPRHVRVVGRAVVRRASSRACSSFLSRAIALGIGEAPQFPAGAKVVERMVRAERTRQADRHLRDVDRRSARPSRRRSSRCCCSSFGWRYMFVIMGVLGIAVAIGWYIVYRNRADIEARRRRKSRT